MRGLLPLVLSSAIIASPIVTDHLLACARNHHRSATGLLSKTSATRRSSTDLEIAGDLAGLPEGSVRYLARQDLLTLPQVTFQVKGDPNFVTPTQVSGVLLENLARDLAGSPTSDVAIAICADDYRSHYPTTYLTEHHPVLVLTVNGQSPEHWPKDVEGHGLDMGPYLISHQEFQPAFKILSHEDEAQIPWGVTRLEFRNEKQAVEAIAPPSNARSDAAVQNGFRIAQQNCLRCHNMKNVGGQKAHRPWQVLSAWAATSPDYFAAYVRNPKSKNPRAEMYANPHYDDATLNALIAYFRTFSSQEKP